MTMLLAPVQTMKGIGPKKAAALAKINIEVLGDFLSFYPRAYQDRRHILSIREAQPGQPALIRATADWIENAVPRHGKKQLLKLLVRDGSGEVEVVFFNAHYLAGVFKQGQSYDFYGKITTDAGKQQMIHPEFSSAAAGERGILPIYPLSAGVSQTDMRKWQRIAQQAVDQIEDPLPTETLKQNRLRDLRFALRNIHFPEDERKRKEAKFRLVFEELFFLQIGLFAVKNKFRRENAGIAFDKTDLSAFFAALPYPLTGAQRRTIAEIETDMEADAVMNRLVQGDVGAGKTAVAQAALFKSFKSGYQSAFMAPTEILANQQYRTLCRDFDGFGIRVALLTGSLPAKEKKKTLDDLAAGRVDILVGTHAIVQPGVRFHNLGLVVTDEQHRFGVNQRVLLTNKGRNPDVLVMSATPIPRTLAMILYGDLDISIIDELPPGRQPILTKVFDAKSRHAAYAFAEREMQRGKQVYVIAPLVEDSDAIDAKSAESLYAALKKKYPDFSLALLHGAMKQQEKDAIMGAFYQGAIQMLVSTVVIEVGIDVPNANVMLIENAERFGLAQLHQLRGRVGRGKEQSHCFLITESSTGVAQERAEMMTRTTDGFLIAEKDLELRGPGDFFGVRQHGIPELKIADLAKHIHILALVREEAKKLLEKDGALALPEHALLREIVRRRFEALPL